MAEKNSFVGIAPALGGVFIPIVLFVVLFAKEQAWVLAPIAIAFAIMGIFLGYFASKKKK